MSSYTIDTGLVTLVSNDGVKFTITEEVANKFGAVKNILEINPHGDIPLLEVTSKILEKIIIFTKYHVENPLKEDENMTHWDNEFFKLDNQDLFDIIIAANYLDYKELLDLGCQSVANLIKGKSVDEIRKYFNIENDFEDDEIEQIRKENEWIEE